MTDLLFCLYYIFQYIQLYKWYRVYRFYDRGIRGDRFGGPQGLLKKRGCVKIAVPVNFQKKQKHISLDQFFSDSQTE
jgi:hypothetical protein